MKTRHSLNVEGPRRRRILFRPEQALQISAMQFLALALPKSVFVFHTPNGGARSKVEAGIFKRMGVVAGVPDLNFIWQGRYFGIELKAPGETLSVSQRDTQPKMRDAGARIEVADSVSEVIRHLIEFGLPLRLSDDELAYYARRRAA